MKKIYVIVALLSFKMILPNVLNKTPCGEFIERLKYSADGNLIAALLISKVPLFNSCTGQEITVLNSGYSPCSVALSLDNKNAAIGFKNKKIVIWHIENNKITTSFDDHKGAVRSVAYNSDDTILASGSDDKTVMLWDKRSDEKIGMLNSHCDMIESVAFHPTDYKLISGSSDSCVKLWDIRAMKEIYTILTQDTSGLTFSPHGERFTGYSRFFKTKDITLKSTHDGKLCSTLQAHNLGIDAISFSPDNETIASSSETEGIVLIWNLKNSTCLLHQAEVQDVEFRPNSTHLALAVDGRILLLNLLNKNDTLD